jgi:hypothetical protein
MTYFNDFAAAVENGSWHAYMAQLDANEKVDLLVELAEIASEPDASDDERELIDLIAANPGLKTQELYREAVERNCKMAEECEMRMRVKLVAMQERGLLRGEKKGYGWRWYVAE